MKLISAVDKGKPLLKTRYEYKIVPRRPRHNPTKLFQQYRVEYTFKTAIGLRPTVDAMQRLMTVYGMH